MIKAVMNVVVQVFGIHTLFYDTKQSILLSNTRAVKSVFKTIVYLAHTYNPSTQENQKFKATLGYKVNVRLASAT